MSLHASANAALDEFKEPSNTRKHPSNFYASLVNLPATSVLTARVEVAEVLHVQPQHTTTSPDARPAVSFRSSGIHQLSEYRSRVLPAKTTSETTPRFHTREADAEAAYGIASDNLGFALLKKAGWKEGSGLGADRQGRTEPIQAHLNKGLRGIGFDRHAAQQRQQPSLHDGTRDPQPRQQPTKQQQELQLRRQQHKQVQRQAKHTRQKLAQLVEAELAEEDVDIKVKRYKQVERQEAEDARGRAIQQYIHQAFSDPWDSHTSADANPLGRPNRLTATNPLLDDFTF